MGRWRNSEMGFALDEVATPNDGGNSLVAIRPDATPMAPRWASDANAPIPATPVGVAGASTSAMGSGGNAALGGMSSEALGIWWSESDEEDTSGEEEDDEAADKPAPMPAPMMPPFPGAAGVLSGGKSACGTMGKGPSSPRAPSLASTSRGVTGGEGGTTCGGGMAQSAEADYNGFKMWPSTPQQWANASVPQPTNQMFNQRLRDMGSGDAGAGGAGGAGDDETIMDLIDEDENDDAVVGGAGWIDFAELQKQMKLEAANQKVEMARRGSLDLDADALPSPHTLLSMSSQQRAALADRAERRREKEERKLAREARRQQKEARRQEKEQKRGWKAAGAAAGLDVKGSRDAARTLLRHSGSAFEAGDLVTAEHYARQAYGLHPEPLCLLSLANIFVAGPDRIGARGMRLPDRMAAAAAYQQVLSDPSASLHLQAIAQQRLQSIGITPGEMPPPTSMPPPAQIGPPGHMGMMPPASYRGGPYGGGAMRPPPYHDPYGPGGAMPPHMPPQSYRDPYGPSGAMPPHMPPPSYRDPYGGGYGPPPPANYPAQGWGPSPYGMAPQGSYGPPPQMPMHGGYAPQQMAGGYGGMPNPQHPPPHSLPRLGEWDA